jgi:hypothetical protein
VTLPETTACEAMKQWLPIRPSWPMWLPLHRIVSSPTETFGCTTFSSKTNVFSPNVVVGQRATLECT